MLILADHGPNLDALKVILSTEKMLILADHGPSLDALKVILSTEKMLKLAHKTYDCL